MSRTSKKFCVSVMAVMSGYVHECIENNHVSGEEIKDLVSKDAIETIILACRDPRLPTGFASRGLLLLTKLLERGRSFRLF
jgi:hypothetical protein